MRTSIFARTATPGILLLLLCGVARLDAATAAITPTTTYQKMVGFGASTAWASTMSAADADLLWDTTKGAGLNLHRIRIADDGTTSETNIAKLAIARGAKIWAAPWNPPSAWVQTTGSTKKLNPTYAQQWADRLAKFPVNMKAAGVPIYAQSVQNEMDNTGSNHFTPAQLVSFLKTYLGPAMKNTGTKIIAPETQNWCGFKSYLDAILGDATVSAYVPIIATHEYGCSPSAYPQVAQAGKEFWETEMYDWANSNEDPGMTSALRTYGLMHEALTIASVSAWHFWWVYPCSAASCGNGALWSQGSNSKATKRLWIMGNFSRFVRPGFWRIGAPASPTTGVTMSAYKDSALTKIVIVAANSNTSATSQTFTISGIVPTKVTPWITDGTRDLVAQASQNLTSSTFTYSLPASSVTTLVFNLPTSSSLAQVRARTIGTPSWSAGILTVPGLKDERIQIIDAQGRTQFVEVVQGQAQTGLLAAGLYQVRIASGPNTAPARFVVLR
jgi:glucuronoarabinoxylan endo-1,4-beta-xylanase